MSVGSAIGLIAQTLQVTEVMQTVHRLARTSTTTVVGDIGLIRFELLAISETFSLLEKHSGLILQALDAVSDGDQRLQAIRTQSMQLSVEIERLADGFLKGWNREWGSLLSPHSRARIGKLLDRDAVWAVTQTMVSFENLALWAAHPVLAYKVYPDFYGRIIRFATFEARDSHPTSFISSHGFRNPDVNKEGLTIHPCYVTIVTGAWKWQR